MGSKYFNVNTFYEINMNHRLFFLRKGKNTLGGCDNNSLLSYIRTEIKIPCCLLTHHYKLDPVHALLYQYIFQVAYCYCTSTIAQCLNVNNLQSSVQC